jgi:outer membrane protein assembly factor BamD
MIKISIKLFLIFVALSVFTGCASKIENEEYNKPAIHWYSKILKHIYMGELDLADDTFVSLESEHRNSPLISSSMMILVDAHIKHEEYEMANYYLDEYIKRYALEKDLDYIRFLKIKSKYMSFKSQYREQQLILDILDEIEEFKNEYPNSNYIYLVKTMHLRMLMAKASFDLEISNLYTRIDKPLASAFYKQKVKKNFFDQKSMVKVQLPWYRALFENGLNVWN